MPQRPPDWKFWGTAAVAALAFGLMSPAFAQSASDYAAQAERAARSAGSIVGGAAVGAAGGAAVGAIVSGGRGCRGRHCGGRYSYDSKDVRTGAAIGAVAGGATQAYRQNDRYKQVYDDCMRVYSRY